MKKIGDLLGVGLFLVGLWLLGFMLNFGENIRQVVGIIGSVIIIFVEGYYLLTTWKK
mgnify:CR=1 FL=1